MKEYVDLLHLLICQKPHETDITKIKNRSSFKCYYYLENDIVDGNKLPDHLEWTETAINFQSALDFETPEDALDFLKNSILISQEVRKLVQGNKIRLSFIESLLSY